MSTAKAVKKEPVEVHTIEPDSTELCPCEKMGGPCGETMTLEEFYNHIPEMHTQNEIVGALIGLTFLHKISHAGYYRLDKVPLHEDQDHD